MAHKTLIGGTAYEVSGGKNLVGGTAYEIKNGKTLVDGTAYEIGFNKFVPIYDFGDLTAAPFQMNYRCEVLYDTLPFDPSKCNAFMVDDVVYEAEYSEYSNNIFYIQYLTIPGGSATTPTYSHPYGWVFRKTLSSGKWTVWLYCYMDGTHNAQIGTYDE